jgi:ABC-type glycerol-3-phosphate transport system substrate-binding protein
MKPTSLVRRLSMVAVATLLAVGAASATDVQVIISSGFYGVYAELGPAFERASGHHLVTTRGPSMGDSPEAIPARLARGEAADVVILDGGAADELGLRPGSKAGAGLVRVAGRDQADPEYHFTGPHKFHNSEQPIPSCWGSEHGGTSP